MASMMMRGAMQAAASPVYGSSRKLNPGSRQMSLSDFQMENWGNEYSSAIAEVERINEEVEVPNLSHDPTANGVMSKFSRALKRLRLTRKVGMAGAQNSGAWRSIDYFRIKQLVSRPDVRHDVAMMERFTKQQLQRPDGAAGHKHEPIAALDPNNIFMIIWNLIQFVLFSYVIIYIPYRVSFALIGESYSGGCGKDEVIEGIDLFVDTFYLVDLIVSACTQSVSDRGVPLLHLRDTVPNYLLSWVFLRDVAPAVPMSWIEYAMPSFAAFLFAATQGLSCDTLAIAQRTAVPPESDRNSNNENLIKLLRVMRIFRILRVFKLFNFDFVNRLLRQIDPNVKTLAVLFAALMVLVHLLACLWFFVKKDSPSTATWYEVQGLADGDDRQLRVYLSCIYYIVATLATVGYGDISADHMSERMLAIGIMLMGTIVFALIISTASMIVQSSGADDAAHGAKIAMVHEFCRNWSIYDDLKYEILDFFLSSKGVFLENSNIKSVMHSLPFDYQHIVAPFLSKECILRSPLFKGSSPEFLSLLWESLSLESFSAGELLFELGDVPHSFYIVKIGTCLLVNECNVVVAEFTDTDVIGEVSCFLSKPRTHTCVCLKFCEIYVLSAAKLAKLFKVFPDFMRSFSDYCRKKILMEMSAKRQFASMFLDHHPASPSFQSVPLSSPALSSQPPPMILPKKLIALEPLPRGKYLPPKAPEVNQILLRRTMKLSHEERVRLFAEIQMAFSNFDFGALAIKYDRIMNAARASSSPKSRQSEVFASIVQAIGHIVTAYEMPFRFECSPRDPSLTKERHCALSVIPGEISWNENKGSIDVGSAGGDQFFGFLMNIAGKLHRAIIVDMRAQPESADLAS